MGTRTVPVRGYDTGDATDRDGVRREISILQHDKVSRVQPVEQVEEAEGVEAPGKAFSSPVAMPKSQSISSRDELRRRAKAVCVRVRNFLLLGFSEASPSKDGRHIDLDVHRQHTLIDERSKKPYVSNAVQSKRYTLWGFCPRQLVAQFSKLANLYFLCGSIVQILPSVSTTGRYTTLVPLLTFVAISMSGEGFDDLRRHWFDHEENNRIASILDFQASREVPSTSEASSKDTELWSECKWQDIKVGDVLRIPRDQAVPADIVLLSVDGTNALAYIETMALDGETNLKSKEAVPPLASKCHFAVEDPNPNFYKFEGKVSIDDELVPLTNNAIMYHGSVLRNTLQVIGMVVYTGEACKIRMTSTMKPRTKAPALQKVVNKVVIMIICFVFVLSISHAAAYQIWKDKIGHPAFYLSRAGVEFPQLLASYFLMFNPIIPLSLYISLDIVKAVQIHLMRKDVDMYDEESDTPMEPRTSTINEELGQVSYIFSDKTGTLTKNSMHLQRISVAGTVWSHDPGLHDETAIEGQGDSMLRKARRELKQAMSKVNMVTEGGREWTGSSDNECRPAVARQDSGQTRRQTQRKYDQCSNTRAMLDYVQSKPHTTLARQVRFLHLSIALCHTCLPEKRTNGKIAFQAASPDELALVEAAQDLGYLVVDRQSCSITVQVRSGGLSFDALYETYQILGVIEFSRDRRRMSIVVRMPDQRICIFCKGADTVIQNRLKRPKVAAEKSAELEQEVSTSKIVGAQQAMSGSASHDDRVDEPPESVPVSNDSAVLEACFRHVNEFASEGLRTLVYAHKYVDESSYTIWERSYQEATTSFVNRQSRIEKAADQLEQDLELIGATGIEDKLQQGVLETINKLRQASIKIWMLTGDRREAAISVGHSCGFVKNYSTIIALDHTLSALDQSIATATLNIKSGALAHSVVVINGQTLSAPEADFNKRDLFLDLVVDVDSVICCRASPHQKATLLSWLRKKLPNVITLAIGDGANDIAMIHEAHIGIGIAGQEGLQAARASDYSIAQFRFLLKLLLVHGHWNYIRTCNYVLGTFWKEMLFYLTQALFQRWNGYTATSLYEPWSLTLFQPLFTCLPVMFVGIFKKDLAASTLLAVPELYINGQRNGGFNFKKYLWSTFMAASEAVIVFFIMLGLYGEAGLTKDNSLYATGALTFTACVFIISVKMQVLELHNKSTTAAVAMLYSVGAWFVWMLAISAGYTDNAIYYVKGGLLQRFARDATWWLTLILILLAVILYELAVSSLQVIFFPTDVDIFQRYEKDPAIRSQFEQSAEGVLPKKDHR